MLVHYQILLYLGMYNTDAIAANKLCKLNFRYFCLVFSYKPAAGLSGLVIVEVWCVTKILTLAY